MQTKAQVLLIEDDQSFRKLVQLAASKVADITEIATFEEADKRLSRSDQTYDVIFVDLNLNPNIAQLENEGLKLIKSAKRRSPNVVVISGNEDVPIIEQAFDLGATRYYQKSKLALDFKGALTPLILSSNKSRIDDFFKKTFITNERTIIEQFKELVTMGLNFKDHIFIAGPTGVGKSLIARGIHQFCGYSDQDFYHLSIADLKTELVESELFGHKRGSFSGAFEDKRGLLEKCHGKTLFIDDIDLLDQSTQGKLLVFLGHGTFSRVGESTIRKADIRLITASNRNLEKMILENQFRDDFYARINKRKLVLTPLSRRRYDISQLLDHYIEKSLNHILLDQEARDFLVEEYRYPGNVRELESIVIQLSAIEGKVTKDKLPQYLIENHQSAKDDSCLVTDEIKQYVRDYGLKITLQKIEEEILSLYLTKYNGKYTPVSKALKVSTDKVQGILKRIKL